MDIDKLAGLFMVQCEDCKHEEGLVGDCPNFDEDICMWQRELADEAVAIFDVEAITAPAKLKEIASQCLVEAKQELADEAKRIKEAKREERERIQGWLLQWEGLWDMKDIRLFYNQDMNRQSLRGE